jgi:adiponectin receptor
MENLLTIQPQSVLSHDEPLDLEDFFKDSLEPLMKKFKYRLSQFEQSVVNSERLQNYTVAKVNKAYLLLESLVQEWDERREKALEARRQVLQELDVKLTDTNKYYHILTPPDLVSAMTELSKKYHELDLDNNVEMIDNTIDTFMIKMEELDGKISDALDRADKMRECVEEKFMVVAGVANEHIDKLKFAMSSTANRLLMYDELPGPWQSNEVKDTLHVCNVVPY